jgi:hypothetical protein
MNYNILKMEPSTENTKTAEKVAYEERERTYAEKQAPIIAAAQARYAAAYKSQQDGIEKRRRYREMIENISINEKAAGQ